MMEACDRFPSQMQTELLGSNPIKNVLSWMIKSGPDKDPFADFARL
jgi:hypothetical protein